MKGGPEGSYSFPPTLTAYREDGGRGENEVGRLAAAQSVASSPGHTDREVRNIITACAEEHLG